MSFALLQEIGQTAKTDSPSSTVSRAPPPISFTAYHTVDIACFTLEKLADL